MRFSSTTNTTLQRLLNPLSQNQLSLFLLTLYFEEYLNPQVSINQMVNIVSTGHILEWEGMHAVWIDRVYYSLFRRWNPTFWSVKMLPPPKKSPGQSPPYSFKINWNKTFSHISIDPLEIYFSRIFDEPPVKPVCATMVGDKFQISGVQTTEKCICKSEYWI